MEHKTRFELATPAPTPGRRLSNRFGASEYAFGRLPADATATTPRGSLEFSATRGLGKPENSRQRTPPTFCV